MKLVKALLLITLLVIALGVVKKSQENRIKPPASSVKTRVNPATSPPIQELSEEEKSTPATPTPTPIPTPPPQPPRPPEEPAGQTYQTAISESELNTYLTGALVRPTQSSDNPITEAQVTLHERIGLLEVTWQKGQGLAADIRVASDGRTLTIENLNVTGAGFLRDLFEQIAYDFLDGVVNNFITSREKLNNIEVKPGQLILYYRF